MAFKLAEAYVQFSQKGLSGVQGAISRVGSGFSGAVGMAGKFSGVLAGLGIATSAGSMLKLASDAEVTETKFRVLLKSGDAAKKMLAEIDQFSNVTPFDNFEVADATQALLSFQVPADAVFQHLQAIGDVAALTGSKVDDLSTIYGKMYSSNRIMAEDLNQLMDRGIPIVDEFAKQFGVAGESDAGAQIRKLASEGKITRDHLVQAFQDMTAAGGNYAGGMAQLSETASGKMSTMFGVMKVKAKEAGQPFLPLIKRAFDFVTGLANASVLPAIMGKVAGGIESVLAGVGAGMSTVGSFLAPLRSVFADAQGMAQVGIGQMRGIFDDVSAGAMRLMDNVDALFQSFFGGSIMDTVTATFAGLLGVAQKLGQYWMGTLSIAWNLIMELANLSVQALTAASDTFNELWGTVSEGNTVFDSLSAGWSSFQGMIEAGVGSVGSFFTGLIDDLKFFSRNFGTVWDIAVELTSIGIQNAFERIKTFGTNVIEVGTWLVTNWRTIFNDMFTAATTILSNIGTNLSDFYSAVKSWMAGDGFNFEVTGLLDGFEGTTELPELTQPVTIDTTNRLEQLYEDIGRDEMNHLAEQKKRDEQRAADQAAAAEKQKQQAEDTAEAVAAVETKTGNETTKTVQNNERKKRKAAEDTKAAQIGGAEQVFSRTATALAKAAAAKLPTKKPPKAAPDVASPAAASKVAPAARDFKAKAGLPAGIEVKGTQKLETELNQSARGTNELRSSIDQLNQTMKSKSTTARLA